MEQNINQTINNLAKYIQQIIEDGSREELQLLPELVSSLAKLIESYS